MLKKGEIVITKVGTPCYASIVDDYEEVALSRTVLGLTNIHDIDANYLMVFLRCKYGFEQLLRHRELTIQYQLTLPRVKAVKVFIPSEGFQNMICNLVKKYRLIMSDSIQLYTQAQNLLPFAMSQDSRNTSIKSFSEVFMTGRLDSEYVMPKYDNLSDSLQDALTIQETCRIHKANFIPESDSEYQYIELADVGTFGNITGATIADGADLPTRARRLIHTGQVIVSSIEGSLQSIALITKEYDNAICSTGFYVIDSDSYNPETLLMLFKSPVVQSLLKRGCSGTILTSISEVDYDTQNKIALKVQESFTLRRKSEELINLCVKCVELAIESGESEALSYINARLPQ